MDDARTLTMSVKELNRLELLNRVIEKRLTQGHAAAQLGLSLRQVERLCRALRQQRAFGLVSHKRGHPESSRMDCGSMCSAWSRVTTPISARRWPARSSRSETVSTFPARRCASG